MRFSDVAKLRNDFIRITMSMGVTKEEAEDIVQELLIRLYEMDKTEGSLDRITIDNKINMQYIYTSLRNWREKMFRYKRLINVEADMPIMVAYPPPTLELDIELKLNSMHHHYKRLYYIYLQDGSMRKIAEGSKISLRTIWNDLRYIKNELKAHLNEKP